MHKIIYTPFSIKLGFHFYLKPANFRNIGDTNTFNFNTKPERRIGVISNGGDPDSLAMDNITSLLHLYLFHHDSFIPDL